jgi:nickel superoxide dismutase
MKSKPTDKQREETQVKHNKRTLQILMTLIIGLSLTPRLAQAHCQIPCGIYDDHMRVQAMLEDVATIEKAIKSMEELVGKTDIQSQNQMVRWVMNKEDHAQKIIESLSDYFLTQRVKPSQDDYTERLEKHHAVILLAMKAKQGTDIKTVTALQKSVMALEKFYPEHKH